jgi:hypothetical protein
VAHYEPDVAGGDDVPSGGRNTVTGVTAPTVAHLGQTGLHDLVLLGATIVAPVLLLAIVIVVGKLRGDDEEPEEDEPA